MDLRTVPTKSQNAAFRIYDNQATVVLPDRAEVKVLNEIGTFVWNQIDGQRTLAEIIDVVISIYDVSPEEARRDVVEFIGDLREQGMVS